MRVPCACHCNVFGDDSLLRSIITGLTTTTTTGSKRGLIFVQRPPVETLPTEAVLPGKEGFSGEKVTATNANVLAQLTVSNSKELIPVVTKDLTNRTNAFKCGLLADRLNQ